MDSKIIWKIIIIILVALATLKLAAGFSIDNNDEFYVTRGEIVEGSFVVQGFGPGIVLSSNFEWLSLDKSEYVREKEAEGTMIVDDNYLVRYWVTIPENADIDIYRTTIEVQDGDQLHYHNVKVSVQNGLVNKLTKVIMNPKVRVPAIIVTSIMGFILFLVMYMRARRNG